MNSQKKRYWTTIGLFVLMILAGFLGLFLGLERLDTAVLKFRHIGKIAGSAGVILVGTFCLIVHIKKKGS